MHISEFWQGWFCAMAGWAGVDLAWWLACKFRARNKNKPKGKTK